MLDLVQARSDQRDPQPRVARTKANYEHTEPDPYDAVPHEVHRLEVELAEHAMRT
ncbi:MAG: hypothetical protein ABR498_03775 [Candidatus Dormibacteria bacterium]